LLALLALATALAGPSLWAAYHFRAGRRALEDYAVVRARGHLGRCLRVWPRSAAAHLLAARAARAAGAYEEAEGHLEACERFGGDTPELRLEEQLLDVQRGRASPATEELLWYRVRQGHPEVPRILEALALGYLYTYRLGGALDCVERWLRRDPASAGALYVRGLIREGLQDFVRAGQDYRHAVARAPGHAQARRRLGELLLFEGRPDEAAANFEHLLRDEPAEADLLFGLARCHRRQGRTAEARTLLDRLLAGPARRGAVLLERARVAQEEGDGAGAEEGFRRAVAQDPGNAEACYALASCLARRGRKNEARRYLTRAQEIERDLQRLWQLYEEVGKDPADPEPRYQAGLICLRNGQKGEGRRWLLSALNLDPTHQRARTALARAQD
jgi:tetratricopeptide (TPR) repeat protein